MKRQTSRQFVAEAEQVKAARTFAIGAVSDWGYDPEDTGQVVGELAANAVLHARCPFEVSVEVVPSGLRVEVADANPRVPWISVVRTGALSGRGLQIVDELSEHWGVLQLSDARHGAKVVWAELACRPTDLQ
jgi:anti-sigma regulatory factor (Ser/Thr protein kinase)